MAEHCVLDESKICDNCGECNICDLDPNKICDNCMKCLETNADYKAIEIDEIIDDGTGAEEFGKAFDESDLSQESEFLKQFAQTEEAPSDDAQDLKEANINEWKRNRR